MSHDVVMIGERITDADPRVADIILNAATYHIEFCDLTEAPLLTAYVMSVRSVIAEGGG